MPHLSKQAGWLQERPGLVVLTIELEKALSQTAHNMQPTKMWSPYREPLTKYLNKYSSEVRFWGISGLKGPIRKTQ